LFLRSFGAASLATMMASASVARAEPGVSIEIDGPYAAETRRAIERELAALVPAPAGVLSVQQREDDAKLVYLAGDGRRLERSIRVQRASADAAEEIALLAANLARDDASLFGELGDEVPSGSDAEESPPRSAEAASAATPPPQVVVTPTTIRADVRRAESTSADLDPCAPPADLVPADIDFAPFVGMSSSPRIRNATRMFVLNVVGGIGHGLRGLEVGSVMNLTTGPACGMQVAGALDVARRTSGLQVAGAATIALGNLDGAQVAGALDTIVGRVRGGQISGAVNAVAGELDGIQVAGALNVAAGNLRGIQMAGAVNVAAGNLRGVQIAGAVNVASDEVRGMQVGAINVAAGRVRGVQVGVVNIAEKSDLSIGVVNVNYKGRIHVDVWSDLEVGIVAAAVKHGGDHWHSFYGLGTRVTDPGFIGILGFGGHARFSKRVYLDVDALGHLTSSFADGKNGTPLVQARPVIGVNLAAPFALYAGAAFNALFVTGAAKSWAPGYAYGVGPAHLWPGAVFGIQTISE
jgi:hypothetical protein